MAPPPLPLGLTEQQQQRQRQRGGAEEPCLSGCAMTTRFLHLQWRPLKPRRLQCSFVAWLEGRRLRLPPVQPPALEQTVVVHASHSFEQQLFLPLHRRWPQPHEPQPGQQLRRQLSWQQRRRPLSPLRGACESARLSMGSAALRVCERVVLCTVDCRGRSMPALVVPDRGLGIVHSGPSAEQRLVSGPRRKLSDTFRTGRVDRRRQQFCDDTRSRNDAGIPTA